LNRTTGRGILVAALTTVLGFATLMVAHHRGQVGLGFTLSLGVTCCMVASLVFLPALLRLLSMRKEIPVAVPREVVPLQRAGCGRRCRRNATVARRGRCRACVAARPEVPPGAGLLPVPAAPA